MQSNMKTITLANSEVDILICALRDRENTMFRDSEAYKRNGNTEAQKDCIAEMKSAEILRHVIENAK